jgi:AraC family transcriptional regulator
MQQQEWVRAGGTSEMQFRLRASSKGRSWTGFEVALYDTSGGLVEMPAAQHYNMSMHVGTPVLASCRCDGPINKRLQIPGDIDLVPFGCSAAWEDDGPTSVLSMNIAPALVRSVADSMHLNPDRIQIEPHLQIKDPRLQHIGWALKAELEAIDPFGRLYAESLGTALVVHMLRRYAPSSRLPMRRGLSRRQLRRVTDHIQEHLSSDLSLAELASVAAVSPSHLKALFKESTGLPVHQYIIRRRVDFAVELLSSGSRGRKLSDVALQAGFADQSHMARCMRRVIGMTPSSVLARYT